MRKKKTKKTNAKQLRSDYKKQIKVGMRFMNRYAEAFRALAAEK